MMRTRSSFVCLKLGPGVIMQISRNGKHSSKTTKLKTQPQCNRMLHKAKKHYHEIKRRVSRLQISLSISVRKMRDHKAGDLLVVDLNRIRARNLQRQSENRPQRYVKVYHVVVTRQACHRHACQWKSRDDNTGKVYSCAFFINSDVIRFVTQEFEEARRQKSLAFIAERFWRPGGLLQRRLTARTTFPMLCDFANSA